MKVIVLLLLIFPQLVYASLSGRTNSDFAMPALYRYDVLLEHQFSQFVTGDFNGDRNADIALIEPQCNRLVILYGTAVLDEFSPKFFTLPASIQALQAADLNHDGITDLVFLARSPTRLICYYGSSAERLLLKAEIEIEPGAEKMLIFPSHYHTSIFFYGQMQGIGHVEYFPSFGFTRKSTLSSQSIFAQVALCEPSGSNMLPNFVAYSAVERTIKYIRNDQDSLLGPLSFRLERTLSSFLVADFNQNGVPDIVLGFEVSRLAPAELQVLYDIGIQTGKLPLQLSLSASPMHLFAQDFNNDGLTDIFVLNSSAEQLSLFFGKPGGDFQECCALGIDHASQFTLTDLNGDTFSEILFLQPTKKRIVIFSTTSMREHKKTSLLIERLVISPHPTSLVATARKPQPLIGVLGHGQSSLSLIAGPKPWQIYKSAPLGSKIKFIWHPDSNSDLFAISERSDKLFVFSSQLLPSVEKVAELPILALNITDFEHWRISPSSSFLFLIDHSNHEILPQLISYRLTRTGTAQLSEFTFAPFVPIEHLFFLHRAPFFKQHLIAAIERDHTQTITAHLYAFGKQHQQHVQLVEKLQIRLLRTKLPIHTCLCNDFDGDQKPDWLLASSSQTWLLLSSNQYKAESLSSLVSLLPSDFARVIDINGDGYLDILIGKSDKEQLCVAFGSTKGKFSTLKILANNVRVADAKLLKLDSETVLLVANAKLHTLDVIKTDQLYTPATARQ
ncbi:MAG: hypothetical protein CMR00_08155 [[Chlorobium] sp. 445]|nr:MAG: hypothetical protein CMR00_08155 [[Chlorobium] sp. 445]